MPISSRLPNAHYQHLMVEKHSVGGIVEIDQYNFIQWWNNISWTLQYVLYGLHISEQIVGVKEMRKDNYSECKCVVFH